MDHIGTNNWLEYWTPTQIDDTQFPRNALMITQISWDANLLTSPPKKKVPQTLHMGFDPSKSIEFPKENLKIKGNPP